MANLEKTWVPLTYKVSGLYLISRTKTSAFRVKKFIPFGGQTIPAILPAPYDFAKWTSAKSLSSEEDSHDSSEQSPMFVIDSLFRAHKLS